MRPKAVFFDFGHTLFDVREPGELVARTAEALGLRVDSADAPRLWRELRSPLSAMSAQNASAARALGAV